MTDIRINLALLDALCVRLSFLVVAGSDRPHVRSELDGCLGTLDLMLDGCKLNGIDVVGGSGPGIDEFALGWVELN